MKQLKVVQSAIFPSTRYTWVKSQINTTLKKGAKPYSVKRGDLVGIREATSKKNTYRLILKSAGETVVFSADQAAIDKLVGKSPQSEQPTKVAKDATPTVFANLPRVLDKIALTKVFDENITPLWKEGSMKRLANNVAYHASPVSMAKRIGLKGNLPKGTYVTSSLQNSFYWATSFADDDKEGAVVYKMNLAGKKITYGDMQDNPTHATLMEPCAVVACFYLSQAEAKKLMAKI